MKHLSIHIPFAILLLLLTGCTQNDPFAGEGEGAGGGTNAPATAPLRISSLLTADVEITPARATRAAAPKDYPTTGSIGFYVKAVNGYTASNNLEGTYKNDIWQPSTAILLTSKAATVAVYAPYDNTQSTTDPELSLAAVVRADPTKEILSARATDVTVASPSISLTMTHVYSRLKINVTRGGSFTEAATITALSLIGSNIHPTATFQPLEDSPYVYPLGASTGFTPTVTSQTLNATTTTATYDLLVIPSALTNDVLLKLTVNGSEMRTKLPASKFNNALARGKQYTVNLSLRAGELSVSSVTIVPWESIPVAGGDMGFN